MDPFTPETPGSPSKFMLEAANPYENNQSCLEFMQQRCHALKIEFPTNFVHPLALNLLCIPYCLMFPGPLSVAGLV